MAYRRFDDFFPKIAENETRTVTLTESAIGLPAGDYTYFEMFCDERGCDCRRVFLYVVCRAIQEDPLAVIAYGWETREFYVNWFGRDDPKHINMLMGPGLNEADRQTKFAYPLLAIFKKWLVPETKYINRIKRHYTKFRTVVDSENVIDFSKRSSKERLH